MDFLSFRKGIEERLLKPLPGRKAQLLMAPPFRDDDRFEPEQWSNAKKGAVLILFFPLEGSVGTILMKRPVYAGTHSGQVSFPGGKFEEMDGDLMYTALREAKEEVGVDPAKISILGRITSLYIPPSNFLVEPYLAFSAEMPQFLADEKEVEELLILKIDELFHPDLKSNSDIKVRNAFKLRVPHYTVAGNIVWGATAMICSELEVMVRNFWNLQ